MATISALQAYVREKYHAEVHANGGMSASLEFDGGRRHTIYFVFPERGDQRPPHVLVSAPFAEVGAISQEDAIELSSYQTIGGLQRINGFYCLSNTIFLEDLDESEVHNTILILANVADIYEQELGLGDKL